MDKSHIPFSSSSLAPLPPLEPVELKNDINLRVLLAGVWDEALISCLDCSLGSSLLKCRQTR